MTDAVDAMTARVREEFAPRLDILEAAGQVEPVARAAAEEFVARLATRFGFDPMTDAGAMFVTHVAVAFTRLVRGEDEPEVPDVLIEELRQRVDEREAVESAARAYEGRLGARVPEAELLYLTAHVCALRPSSVS